jgi:hypothetical protein
MLRLSFFFAVAFGLSAVTQTLPAQVNINRVEYYVDTDPGYGNATAASIGAGPDISTSFNIATGSLATGLHVVGVRSKDDNGAWSQDEHWLVLKQTPSILTTNIQRVEWYVDIDPGYGNATPISLTPGQELINLSFQTDINSLTTGLHTVAVRSKDANGAWSQDERWLILKQSPSTPTTNIERVEWYIDTDPGYGNATPISSAPGQELINLSFQPNINALATGLHTIAVRSKDANGAWSQDERWLILKPSSATNISNIERVEWYVDSDPGYGNATPISLTPGQDLVNLSFQPDISALQPGLHIVAVRSRNTDKAWSLDERWLLLKPATTAPLSNINYMEYYIDADPGYGNAIPLTFLPNNNFAPLNSYVNITGLTAGAHKIFFRSRAENNAWSFDDTLNFAITSPVVAPAIVVNSIEFTPVCKGSSFKIGYHATGTYNSGNQFIAEISDENGSFANPRQVGNITSTSSGLLNCVISHDAENGTAYKLRVRSTNPALTGIISNQSVTVNKYFIGTDTFTLVVCADETANITSFFNPSNSTVTYSVANPAAAPFGIHSVYAVNNQGCRDTAVVLVKQDVVLWTGAVSSDWHNGANWNTGKVPNDSSHVIIPAGTPNPCSISAADAVAASVQVRSGAPALQVINSRQLMIKAKCSVLPQ